MSKYNRTFANESAQHSALTYEEIDKILRAFPVKKIVELGTAKGALTSYLGLIGMKLNIPVFTFDINKSENKLLPELRVNVIKMHIHSDEGREYIGKLISGEPVYLICDDGNKPDEFNTFAKFLCKGSVISVHDWNDEIHPRHVEDTVRALNLTPFNEKNWMLRDMYFATWSV